MTVLVPEMRSHRPWRLWRTLHATPVSFRLGAIILFVHIVIAATGPWWAPYGYAQMGTGIPLAGWEPDHLFGTDMLGRDVFSRTVHGGRIVMAMALSGTLLGVALGALLGTLSAYLGGWFDEIAMRLVEALISIPYLVLALLAVTVAGPVLSGEPALVVGVIALVFAPRVARVARAAALDVITRDFITVARLRGDSPWTVIRREIVPNVLGTLFVEFALRAGYAPVLIGSLGFLGFGLRPPTPEWGLMIAEYRDLLLVAPGAVLGPALMLGSLVVGLNLATEGMARMIGRSVRHQDG